ncbi:MAG: hypothetical protein EXQ69_05360 [Acidimicrobiia bacterium]|nr:hypothetical protein [Acidimicrobiia bacterium]
MIEAMDIEVDVDPDVLSTLLWEAAAGLNESERAVLELTLRDGLEGDELALAMGASLHHVIASRMRQSL